MGTSSTVSSPRTQGRPSPFLLLLYPIILTAGSAFSVISPIASSARPTPLAPGMATDLNASLTPEVTNYFANKHNLVNQYFVKIGWFWTTLAFALLQITLRARPLSKQTHYLQSALRYSIVTLAWIFTTQWSFGPALIDRSFTVTGGFCEARPAKMEGNDIKVSHINSGPLCKAAGGRWRGGHDISGHVFMLVLSSAFLLYELFLADQHSSHPSVSPRAAAAVAAETSEEEKKAVGGWESEQIAKVRVYTRYFLYGVVALDLWMLMMTAIWFHTWLEKLSGLLLAGATIWIVYFLGDFVPQWRGIIGGL